MKAKPLPIHPFAELAPKMSDSEYAALKADVVANERFTDAGYSYQGKLLDGRHRQRIAEETGIPFTVLPFSGDDAAAVAFVKSKIMHRNLDAPRRACVAIGFARMYEQEARERMLKGKADPSKLIYEGRATSVRAMDSLGKAFDVNPTYLYQAKKLADAAPKLFQQVFDGTKRMPVAVRELQRRDKAKRWKSQAKLAPLRDDALQILIGDCRPVLDGLPPETIDLVFCDPPYGIGEKYNSFDDRLSREQLMKLVGGCVDRLPRVLKPAASVFVMMSSQYAEDVGALLRRAGLHRQAMIVWAESFGAHNGKFWTDCYRVIHHYTKHPTKFTFHHEDKRLYIPSWRTENGDGRADADGKLPGNVWGAWTDRGIARLVDNAAERIPDRRAVNQLPVKLVERIVLAASDPGQTVCDPFHGTGTTARAALANGRRYLGIEIDAEVADASRQWIAAHLSRGGTK